MVHYQNLYPEDTNINIGISFGAYNYGKNYTYKPTPSFCGAINIDATVPFEKGFYARTDLDLGKRAGGRIELGNESKNVYDEGYYTLSTKVSVAPYVAASIYGDILSTESPKDEQERKAFTDFYGDRRIDQIYRTEAVVGAKLNIFTPPTNGPASNVTFGAEIGNSREASLPKKSTGEVIYQRNAFFGRTYFDGEVKFEKAPVKLGLRLDVSTPFIKNPDFSYELNARIACEL